jgi:acetolactate synthase I/II/III large subunit
LPRRSEHRTQPCGRQTCLPRFQNGGTITSNAIAAMLGALLPEGAIICDESATTGQSFFRMSCSAAPHDWLQLTGGAIGEGMPLATGAAVACPDRKVNLQADGSGMYTLQSLWTQAREGLNVMTLIWANRAYAILRHELANVGVNNPGPKALGMVSLGNPDLDWVSLAKGMGVEARRVDTVDELVLAFRAGVAVRVPFLRGGALVSHPPIRRKQETRAQVRVKTGGVIRSASWLTLLGGCS